MLVLTRKVDETILIGDDVKISVLSIDGERVRGLTFEVDVVPAALEVLASPRASACGR